MDHEAADRAAQALAADTTARLVERLRHRALDGHPVPAARLEIESAAQLAGCLDDAAHLVSILTEGARLHGAAPAHEAAELTRLSRSLREVARRLTR